MNREDSKIIKEGDLVSIKSQNQLIMENGRQVNGMPKTKYGCNEFMLPFFGEVCIIKKITLIRGEHYIIMEEIPKWKWHTNDLEELHISVVERQRRLEEEYHEHHESEYELREGHATQDDMFI